MDNIGASQISIELNREQFEQTLIESGIPPRPAAIEVVRRELNSEDPDLRLVERAIRADVALAGGVLKTVNSPFYGMQRRISSLMEALSILGLKATAQIIACVALKESFPLKHLDRFWDASMKIAGLSSWLVGFQRWPGLNREDAYTFALFRDSGIALLLTRVPAYETVLRQANAEKVASFSSVELGFLPVSHEHTGAMLTGSWWLPDELTAAIRHHHDAEAIAFASPLERLTPQSSGLIAVAQLAEFLYQQATGLGHTEEWGKLGTACQARLGITDIEIASLASRAKEVLAEF